MSTLTNQPIKDTYQGLLKLANSTTGITSNLQAIEDGLGNNTGLKLKTNYFYSDNIFSSQLFKADFFGNGIITASSANPTGAPNYVAGVFWDNGVYDYSAFTYTVITASTTSDTVEFSFYTMDFYNGIGVAPATLIASGITLTGLTSTGTKTVPITTLSFSGYGAGFYFWVYKISNSGVTPTIRLANNASLSMLQSIETGKLGWVQTLRTGTPYDAPFKTNNSSGLASTITYTGLTSFPNPWTSTEAAKFQNPMTTNAPAWGFLLHTIK